MVLSLLFLPSLHWRCLLTLPGWYLTDGIDRLFRCHEDTDDILFSRYSLGQSQAQSSDSLEAWGRRTFSLSVITLESSDVANSHFWEPSRWSCHWVWPLGRPRQWETQRSASRVYGRRALTWDHAVLHGSPSLALSRFAFKQLYTGHLLCVRHHARCCGWIKD